MKASTVLDLHGDLLSRWEDPRFAEVIHRCFMVDLKVPNDELAEASYQLIDANARYLRATVGRHLKTAADYRVSEDMCHLLMHAAGQLDDEDTWDHALAPTETGLVRFEIPLLVRDIQGRQMKLHWMSWGPALSEGPDNEPIALTLVTYWNDAHDPDVIGSEYADGLASQMPAEILGRWRWIGAVYTQDGAPLGPELIELDEDVARAEKIVHDEFEPAPYSNTERLVHALWLLLGQTLTERETETVDRATRRRAERHGMRPEVTVIKLRRVKGAVRAEGEAVVDWQRRWMVTGHWRWQPYGPKKSLRRRIYVADFIKGPADKPLVLSKKLHSLDR